MSHLVAGTTERFDLQEMLDELRGAHTYLAKHGARALMHAADLGASPTWGLAVLTATLLAMSAILLRRTSGPRPAPRP